MAIGVLRHFQQYIVTVSSIDGRNWNIRKKQVSDKL
jgi:hypothetical protein